MQYLKSSHSGTMKNTAIKFGTLVDLRRLYKSVKFEWQGLSGAGDTAVEQCHFLKSKGYIDLTKEANNFLKLFGTFIQ